MSSNGVNANIPQGIEYRATDDADDISWSNRKVADGRCGVVCCAAMLLIWLSVCLWVTDLSLSGSLAQPLGIGLLLFVWGAMAVPVHYLMKTLGRESIRVTDSGIEFRFAGLGWPRRVVAAREEMAGMSLIDRRELGSIAALGHSRQHRLPLDEAAHAAAHCRTDGPRAEDQAACFAVQRHCPARLADSRSK